MAIIEGRHERARLVPPHGQSSNLGYRAIDALNRLVAREAELEAALVDFRRQYAMIMDGIRTRGTPDGQTEWRDENYTAWEMWLGRMVECPECAFMFSADHTDDKNESYTCPNCAMPEPWKEDHAWMRSKWQTAEARAQQLEDALRDILDVSTGWCRNFPTDTEALKTVTMLGTRALDPSARTALESQ